MGPARPKALRPSWKVRHNWRLFDGAGIPADSGIYTHPIIDCDADAETEAVLGNISSAVARVLDMGKIPVLFGGEHTVSVGAFSALKNHFNNVGIVQFDAHADLRDTYEGTPYSHACVMHRALDLGLHDFPDRCPQPVL